MDAAKKNSEEIWPDSISGAKYGLTVVALSSVLFYICGLLGMITAPKKAEKQKWRWKNTFVSLIHAAVSGVWAVCSFIDEPLMAEDMIKTHTVLAHTLTSVSVGYFVYDTLDMLLYQRNRKTMELILHHVVIIICIGLTVITKVYVPYAVLALLVELNGIFLHIRQLLQICGFTKSDSVYRLNSLVNLVTFLVFRILTLAWMTRWIVINRDLVPLPFYTLGSVGLAIVTLMNIVLFYRLLQSDFLRKKKEAWKKDE